MTGRAAPRTATMTTTRPGAATGPGTPGRSWPPGLRRALAPAALLVALSPALPAPAAAADAAAWRSFSDVGVGALLALSLGAPAVEGDGEGVGQAALSLAAVTLATESLKAAVSSQRPDLSDDHSFPSGHTSRAFAAATTLLVRRGQRLGLPALAAAGVVGVARVEGHKHHWADVAAGAALGIAAGCLLTERPQAGPGVAITPWVDDTGAGLVASFAF